MEDMPRTDDELLHALNDRFIAACRKGSWEQLREAWTPPFVMSTAARECRGTWTGCAEVSDSIDELMRARKLIPHWSRSM